MIRRDGYTLLEMLVALTLVALLAVAGQQALSLAARSAAAEGDGGHSFLLRRQIGDWLNSMMPVRSVRRDRAPLVFEGQPDRLVFVTGLSERFGTPGPHRVTLTVDEVDGRTGLVAAWLVLHPGGGADVGRRVLVDGVRSVRLRYWSGGEGSGSEGSGWFDTWPSTQRLPGLIEMTLVGGGADGWPPIRVALHQGGA
jgi:general secretion pathway protein J